jgi:hypothetical protein
MTSSTIGIKQSFSLYRVSVLSKRRKCKNKSKDKNSFPRREHGKNFEFLIK